MLIRKRNIVYVIQENFYGFKGNHIPNSHVNAVQMISEQAPLRHTHSADTRQTYSVLYGTDRTVRPLCWLSDQEPLQGRQTEYPVLIRKLEQEIILVVESEGEGSKG